MRRDGLLATIELAMGLGMLASFVLLLLVPAAAQLLLELPWAIGALRMPAFGIHPHWVAEARYAPALVVLAGFTALVACCRWLASRRRS